MASIIKRISSRLQKTGIQFASDCNFHVYYACLRLCDELGGRIGLKQLSEWGYAKKTQWIQEYLRTNLHAVLGKYAKNEDIGIYQDNAPIWVCWWTGKDTAPELVKKCIESIYGNAGAHPVYLITKDNYQQYLEIPEFILGKVRSSQMGVAHLADYIRVRLLATHGGLWLDATMFCSRQIPDICFDLPLFTCKGPVQKCGYVSDMRWVTFCLGGWKGNVFYSFLADAFERYWSSNDYAIDYLFFDHIILTAYDQIPAVRDLLDKLPENNIHRDDLQAAMNAALPASQFEAVLQPDTILYKLSWRETYSLMASDGTPSVYARFLGTP